MAQETAWGVAAAMAFGGLGGVIGSSAWGAVFAGVIAGALIAFAHESSKRW
jgi:hypothetical protein